MLPGMASGFVLGSAVIVTLSAFALGSAAEAVCPGQTEVALGQFPADFGIELSSDSLEKMGKFLSVSRPRSTLLPYWKGSAMVPVLLTRNF